MNISQLGSLTPHARFPDWLVSGPVAVPYFDGLQLPFTLEGFTEADQAETQAAMDAFFALGNDARLRTSGHVFANYRHMADIVGEDDLGCHIDTAEAVWPHVCIRQRSSSPAGTAGSGPSTCSFWQSATGSRSTDFRSSIGAERNWCASANRMGV